LSIHKASGPTWAWRKAENCGGFTCVDRMPFKNLSESDPEIDIRALFVIGANVGVVRRREMTEECMIKPCEYHSREALSAKRVLRLSHDY
jgi:hypothetical protein